MSIKSTMLSGTAPDTIYQSNGQNAVTTTYFCNVSLGMVTINVYLVPSGGIATPENLIYWALEIDASDTYIIDTERLILDNGDAVIAEASGPGSIVATVSYVEV